MHGRRRHDRPRVIHVAGRLGCVLRQCRWIARSLQRLAAVRPVERDHGRVVMVVRKVMLPVHKVEERGTAV